MVCIQNEKLNIEERKTEENSKPKALKVQLDKIPQSLTSMRRWVLWRYEWKDSRWTKVLYNPHVFCELEEHKRASSTNPKTWGSFKQVANLYNKYGSQIDGVGFVLSDKDGIVGIDLDKTKDTPHEDHFLKLGTYVERSPSGKGLRLFGYGTMPNNEGRKKDWLELYNNVRFLTITGHRQTDTDDLNPIQDKVDALLQKYFPAETKAAVTKSTVSEFTKPATSIKRMDDAELLKVAKENDYKFDSLWNAKEKDLPQKEDGSVDNSRSVFALCVRLAYFTKDAKQIERLVDASAWAEYDKWKTRPKWRESCIQKALLKQTGFYVSDKLIAETVESAPEKSDNGIPKQRMLKWGHLKAISEQQIDKWVVKGLLEPGTSTVFSGGPFSGKTTVIADLMGCVACERPFLGHEIQQRCPILFINCDRLRERHVVQRISRAFTDPIEETKLEEVFNTINLPFIPATITTMFLEDVMAEVIKTTDSVFSDTGIVVLDTLRGAFLQEADSGAENDASFMTKILAPLRKLSKESNWAFITPHHNAKATNRYSGSAAIIGNSDNVWNLTRDEGSKKAKIHFLLRDGEKFVNFEERSNGLFLLESPKIVPVDKNDPITQFIEEFPIGKSLLRKEAKDDLFPDMSDATFRNRLKDAQRAGIHPRLEQLGAGTKEDPYRYLRV